MRKRCEAAMSEKLEALAARKQLLVARSTLYRLQLVHESDALRRSLTTPRGIFSIATSAPVRPLLFSALLFVAGRSRFARLVRGAMMVLTVVKVLRAAAGFVQSASPPEEAPAPKVSGSHMTPHPEPGDPQHREWIIDEADDESFPASDPSAVAQPHLKARGKLH